MSDVGRRFRATRVLELSFELTDADVADQDAAGESAIETAQVIAGSTPESEWTIVDQEVEEM